MKTRNGFVSNSSSTSFTCDVCGENQSGMDMSRSEAGMAECENGHTFCEGHQRDVEISDDGKRQFIIKIIQSSTWRKPEDLVVMVEKVKKMSSDDLEEEYHDYISDGIPDVFCPICMLEELDERDAFQYLLKKSDFDTMKEVLVKIKEEFATYDDFKAFIRPPKK